MNFKQRLEARRDIPVAPQLQAPSHEPVQREALGQVISSSQIRKEQEQKQRFDAFKEAHGRHAISEKEFDQWQAKQRQHTAQTQPKIDDRVWEAAMRREVTAPVLKDRAPIDLSVKQDALDRVATHRQTQAMQLDINQSIKKRQMNR